MLTNTISILIFGSLFFLGFLLLSNPLDVNKKGNRLFGIFIVLWASYWLEDLPFFPSKWNEIGEVSCLLDSIQFLASPIFYLAIIYFSNPEYRLQKNDRWLAIIIIMHTTGRIIQIFYPVQWLDILLVSFTLITSSSILFLCYRRIRKHQKRVPHFASETSEIDLNWLIYIICGILMLSILITIYNVIFYPRSLNMLSNILVLVIVYFSGYHALKQKEIYPKGEEKRKELITIDQAPTVNPKKKLMSDEDLIQNKSMLVEIMSTQKPFLDCEINLTKLAELSSMSTHHLSFVINNGFNENFFQFVNRYRVEKAKELLLSQDAEKLSMIGIAFESGFNSKTSFNTTFKKMVGKTPSEFRS